MIDMSSFMEGILAGYGIAIPVGAVAILIINISMQCRFRIGFMAGAGAATADLLYALLASLAGANLIALLKPIMMPLRIASGLVLIVIAIWAIWQGWRSTESPQKSAEICGPLRMYLQFVGITIINPLTVVYFTALILGRENAALLTPSAQFQFILGVGLASLSWQTVLAGVGSFAGNRLSLRFRRLTTLMGNLLVIFLGLRILLLALY